MDAKEALEQFVDDSSFASVLEDLSCVAREQKRTNLADRLLDLSMNPPTEMTAVVSPAPAEEAEPTKVRVTAPDGTPITGIIESVQGKAWIDPDDFKLGADGHLLVEYDGTGTKMFWDTQLPYEENGHRLFHDESGNEWREQDLVILADAPTDEWRGDVSQRLRDLGHASLADEFGGLSDEDAEEWRSDHADPEDAADAVIAQGAIVPA